jgi:hypothetical protein
MSAPANIQRFFDGVIGMAKIGGHYGIPRPGLVFERRAERRLVLVQRMPYDPAMAEVITPEQLEAQQQNEYEGMVHFGALCGWLVTDETQ